MNDITHVVTCDNYDGFSHINFIFSWKFISIIEGLFNDEINPKVQQ